jgi:hypothetical protein
MKTVYVIGSGASAEAGLPTGPALKGHIAKLLDIRFDKGTVQQSGDDVIMNALRSLPRSDISLQAYVNEALHIADALPLALSIDNFLDAHRDNARIEFLGKAAIVMSILDAERGSRLFVDPRTAYPKLKFDKIKDTWYLPFFQLLTENCELQDLEDRFNRVALIVFNYDRCIEHFIFHALKRYYKLSDLKAADLVQRLSIHHPYGSAGSQNWEEGPNKTAFGSKPNAQELIQITKQIRTFTEGTDPESSEITKIRNHISDSSTLVFLGFAFHKLNMNLLMPQDLNPKTGQFKCFASAFEISSSDCDAIREQVNSLFSTEVHVTFSDVKCNEFFKEFWRSLAF